MSVEFPGFFEYVALSTIIHDASIYTYICPNCDTLVNTIIIPHDTACHYHDLCDTEVEFIDQ